MIIWISITAAIVFVFLFYQFAKLVSYLQLKKLRRKYNEDIDKSRRGQPGSQEGCGRQTIASDERERDTENNGQPEADGILQNADSDSNDGSESITDTDKPELTEDERE